MLTMNLDTHETACVCTVQALPDGARRDSARRCRLPGCVAHPAGFAAGGGSGGDGSHRHQQPLPLRAEEEFFCGARAEVCAPLAIVCVLLVRARPNFVNLYSAFRSSFSRARVRCRCTPCSVELRWSSWRSATYAYPTRHARHRATAASVKARHLVDSSTHGVRSAPAVGSAPPTWQLRAVQDGLANLTRVPRAARHVRRRHHHHHAIYRPLGILTRAGTQSRARQPATPSVAWPDLRLSPTGEATFASASRCSATVFQDVNKRIVQALYTRRMKRAPWGR